MTGLFEESEENKESNNEQNINKSTKSETSPKWPSGYDYFGATFSFTISLHSLWSVPVCVIHHGGGAFLLLYLVSVALLGGPLLLLSMFHGQYSGLAPGQLYQHLCPYLQGLGVAVCIQAGVRAVLDTAVIMWAGQAGWILFTLQDCREGFFRSDVLQRQEDSMEYLGQVVGELALVLVVVCLVTFILVAAGTRSVGKVCLVLAPICFMLLVSLTIRTCLAPGGPAGILTLLTPDWSILSQPTVWAEAVGQAVFSLQLGLGAVSAYSSHNSYNHNIVRDCAIIIFFNILWVILAIFFTFSLLGVAHDTEAINIQTVSGLSLLNPRQGWLSSIPVIETAFSTVTTGWLWAGLFFLLIILISISSLFGYLEVITSSLISNRTSLLPYKPALTFCSIICIFLLNLALATQGGVHAYQLLLTFLSSWPSLLFSLLAVFSTVFCHGTRSLISDLSAMTKSSLPHWFTSHLSVAYITILPLCLLVLILNTILTFHFSLSGLIDLACLHPVFPLS